MRRALILLALLLAIAFVLVGWRLAAIESSAGGFGMAVTAELLQDPARIERGRYIAVAGNCAGCHTSTEPMAGGVDFHTEFGVLYSTNITPDVETGIGGWTADDFQAAMRHGRRPDGAHLYPVFPYPSYTRMTDDDILDLFAYLQSLEPVRRPATPSELVFPFSRRELMAVWKALFLDPGLQADDPAQSARWHRGRYVVEALAHCGECHSPRNALGALDPDRAMTGGVYLDRVPDGRHRPWSAPNLTSSEYGLGAWPEGALADYLATGRNAFLETFGPMNAVILDSTRHLTESDVAAAVDYLRSLPPARQPPAADADTAVLGMGRTVYNLHCGTCHLPTGEGDPDMAPRIGGGSLVTRATDPASLINVILYAPQLAELHPPSTWRNAMDEFQYQLDDEEIAALASFVRQSWGNGAGRVTADEVARQR